MEHVIFNCVGPLPCSKSGHTHLLSYLSGFSVSCSLCASSYYSQANLKSIESVHPNISHSQNNTIRQGTSLTSHLLQVLKQLCIKHNKSTTFRAQCTLFHQTERFTVGSPFYVCFCDAIRTPENGFTPFH